MAEVELNTLVYRVKYIIEADKALAEAKALEQKLKPANATATGGGGSSANNISSGAALSPRGKLSRSSSSSPDPFDGGGTFTIGNNEYTSSPASTFGKTLVGWAQSIDFGYRHLGAGRPYNSGNQYSAPIGPPTAPNYRQSVNMNQYDSPIGPPPPPMSWRPIATPPPNTTGGWTPGLVQRHFDRQDPARSQGSNGRMGAGARIALMLAAREGLRAVQDYQELNRNTLLAGNNQDRQLDALISAHDKLGSIPIAGQAVSLLQDPSGAKFTQVLATQASANAMNAKTAGMGALADFRMKMSRGGELAGTLGAERERLSADYDRQDALQRANEIRMQSAQASNDVIEKHRVELNASRDFRVEKRGYTTGPGRALMSKLLEAEDRHDIEKMRQEADATNSTFYDNASAAAQKVYDFDVRMSGVKRASVNDSLATESTTSGRIAATGRGTFAISQGNLALEAADKYKEARAHNETGAANSILGNVGAHLDANASVAAREGRLAADAVTRETTASRSRRLLGNYSDRAALDANEAKYGASYTSKGINFADLDPTAPNYNAQYQARLGAFAEANTSSLRDVSNARDLLRIGTTGDLASSKLRAGGFDLAAGVRDSVTGYETQIKQLKDAHAPLEDINNTGTAAINNLAGIRKSILEGGDVQTTGSVFGVNFREQTAGSGKIEQLLSQIVQGTADIKNEISRM